MTVNLDWENLGFSYMKLPYRYIAYYRNGQWEEGTLTEDATLHISESSPSLHYGQQAFEGLKAYRTKDDSIQLFRPDKNAERLQQTACSCRKFLQKCLWMQSSRLSELMKNMFHLMEQVELFTFDLS